VRLANFDFVFIAPVKGNKKQITTTRVDGLSGLACQFIPQPLFLFIQLWYVLSLSLSIFSSLGILLRLVSIAFRYASRIF